MHWLLLMLAIAAMAFAFISSSMTMLVTCLLAALLLFVLWVLAMYRYYVADSGRDVASMLDPEELRRIREQAQATREAMPENSNDLAP